MARMHVSRPEWANRRTGDLALPEYHAVKLTMRNIYGYGADCVAYAVFSRRLLPGEITALTNLLREYKHELQHGLNMDTDDWDELTAVEIAVEKFAAEYGLRYALRAESVIRELEF